MGPRTGDEKPGDENPGDDPGDHRGVAAVLAYGEFFLDAVVAVALGVGGVILLGAVVFDFARGLGHGQVVDRAVTLLSGLLLVFIFTELIGTLRAVVATQQVRLEPFLVVGIVASIRRVIVIGAEAEHARGTPRFRDVMLEIGVLTGTVLVLGLTLFLLRTLRVERRATNRGRTDRGPSPDPSAPGRGPENED